MPRPRVVYLHGFASGPKSAKAVQVQERLERDGVSVEVPDLNLPSFEHLRVSRIVEHVTALVTNRGPLVLAGSSLGSLCALHVASRAPSDVREMVILCPALAADDRWRGSVGEEGIVRWRREGSRRFFNFVTNDERPVDFGFYEDLARMAHPPDPRIPCHVIHGRRDETVPFSTSEAFARRNRATVRLEPVDDDHALLGHVDRIVAAIRDAALRVGSPRS